MKHIVELWFLELVMHLITILHNLQYLRQIKLVFIKNIYENKLICTQTMVTTTYSLPKLHNVSIATYLQLPKGVVCSALKLLKNVMFKRVLPVSPKYGVF